VPGRGVCLVRCSAAIDGCMARGEHSEKTTNSWYKPAWRRAEIEALLFSVERSVTTLVMNASVVLRITQYAVNARLAQERGLTFADNV